MSIRTEQWKYVSLQQTFNDMYIPLMRQGKCSLNSTGSCKMRGEGETACAVGMLLADNEVDRGGKGEAMGAGGYATYFGKAFDGFEYEVVMKASCLIDCMQNCHDASRSAVSFREEFGERALAAARDFALTLPEWEETPAKPKNKPGRTSKRYIASVYRRAAKLLEDNQTKHVMGYGSPFAKDHNNQSFCAIAAVDIILEKDGYTPSAIASEFGGVSTADCEHISSASAIITQDNSFIDVPVCGVSLYSNEHVLAETSQLDPDFGGSSVGTFNDHQPHTYKYTKTSWDSMITPEGTKRTVAMLRGVAARFEHAGQRKSPKKVSK